MTTGEDIRQRLVDSHLATSDEADAYLAWAKRQHSKEHDIIPPDAVGITPELTQFLGWVEKKQVGHQ